MQTKDKIKNIVIIVLVLLVFIGGGYLASELMAQEDDKTVHQNQTSQEQDTYDGVEDEYAENVRKEFVSIGIDQYLSYKNGEEAKIIFIGRPTCSYCMLQKPLLENIAFEYDLEVNYLNTDELSEEDHKKLLNSDSYFANGYGTPITMIVKDGKIIDKAEGLHGKTYLINKFKNNGFIQK